MRYGSLWRLKKGQFRNSCAKCSAVLTSTLRLGRPAAKTSTRAAVRAFSSGKAAIARCFLRTFQDPSPAWLEFQTRWTLILSSLSVVPRTSSSWCSNRLSRASCIVTDSACRTLFASRRSRAGARLRNGQKLFGPSRCRGRTLQSKSSSRRRPKQRQRQRFAILLGRSRKRHLKQT